MALTITPLGGFWEDYASGSLTLEDRDPVKRKIGQLLDKEGLRELKELMLTATGAAAGASASSTYKRVSVGESDGTFNSILNGLRTIDTVTAISRVTTAADVTEIKDEVLEYTNVPSSYPANGDGNPREVSY